MWPWGHLAVGYLLYSFGLRQAGRRPTAPAVVLLALGTQFPDLVDKPLAWYLGVLASGRSLGHSLVVAVVVLAVVAALLAPRVGREPVAAFGVGYLSHLVADFPFERALAGEFEYASYLVWPLVPPPEYDVEPSLVARLAAYEFGPVQVLEVGLVVLAAVVWYRDGRPGLDWCRRRVRRDREGAPRP